ncbi:MAG: tetratricopeptide repeat protein, partial [Acidobacteriota bacterium]
RQRPRACVTLLVALALVAPLVASSAGPTEPGTGPMIEIALHVSGADQAFAAGEVLLAEHRARLALALAYTSLGQLEILDSNPQAAEEVLARAATRAPSFALDARALLHGLQASRGELDSALGELRLLTQTAPDHTEARRQLVLSLVRSDTLDEAALELEALRQLDAEAADALTSWLRPRDPSSGEPGAAPRAPIYAGRSAQLPAAEREALRDSLTSIISGTEARLASALEASRPSEAHVAGSPSAELALARVALSEGEIKRALDHSRRALDAAPSSESLLRFFATVALDAGLTSVAAPSVETLARMDPASGEYAFMVGRVWIQLGKTGEASEALLRAIELDPDLLPARRELALAFGAESRFEASKQHLELFLGALEDPWRDLDAQAALAEAEQRLGDSTAAEARAQQVLEKAPGHARARLVLGLVLADRGEFERARSELEQAVAVDPKLAQAHYRLSFACTRLGDRECAERHLKLYRRALGGAEAEVVQMTNIVRGGKPQARSMTPESQAQKSEGRSRPGGGG